eukprot:1409322-Prymnesium_polylepis.1
MTDEVSRCASIGGWSPCRGGADARHEGSGYCENGTDGGYEGPWCQLCVSETHYFDKLDAHCRDCGDVAARVAITACFVLLLILVVVGAGAASILSKAHRRAHCRTLIKAIRSACALWQEAGMQFKVKALVGMYQCLAAIPGVYNVNPPLGLEEYIRCVTCPCAFDGDVASSLLACPAALIVPRPDPEESSPAQFHCV